MRIEWDLMGFNKDLKNWDCLPKTMLTFDDHVSMCYPLQFCRCKTRILGRHFRIYSDFPWDFIVIQWDLMGFNKDLMGLNRDLMRFNRDLIGI